MADFDVDTDGDVRVRRSVPDGEVELVLNPDGVAVNHLDADGQVTDEAWYTYGDLDPSL